MSEESSFIAQLAARLRAANADRQPIGPLDFSPHQRVLAHEPEDMTVTVESGLTLAALQSILKKHGQWLPLDPAGADQLTIRRLLDENLSGPRRLGHGTARDWLLGLKAVLADGRVIESGGKVVKNVAGYDLHKLLIGARGELGVIVEATFKVSPLPQSEIVESSPGLSVPAATDLVRAILKSPINPVALELFPTADGMINLIVAFAGTPRETQWQRDQITSLANWQETTLDCDAKFHQRLAGRAPLRRSVLPERLVEALGTIVPPWIARAGNGVIYSLPTSERVLEPALHPLHVRIRQLFDPHGVLRTRE